MDEMNLTIVLRKEIPDRETGKQIFDLVIQRLADKPNIKISGSVSNHFAIEDPE